MITYLYWIHYPHHKDPLTEGYIGITNNLSKRLKYHSTKKYSDNDMLYGALGKGAIQTVLGLYTARSEALYEELRYRPTERIGWNIIAGGVSPPSQKGSKKPHLSEYNASKVVSQHTKQRMSASGKGRKWYTNGTTDVKLFECPEGYYPGRSKKPPLFKS